MNFDFNIQEALNLRKNLYLKSESHLLTTEHPQASMMGMFIVLSSSLPIILPTAVMEMMLEHN